MTKIWRGWESQCTPPKRDTYWRNFGVIWREVSKFSVTVRMLLCPLTVNSQYAPKTEKLQFSDGVILNQIEDGSIIIFYIRQSRGVKLLAYKILTYFDSPYWNCKKSSKSWLTATSGGGSASWCLNFRLCCENGYQPIYRLYLSNSIFSMMCKSATVLSMICINDICMLSISIDSPYFCYDRRPLPFPRIPLSIHFAQTYPTGFVFIAIHVTFAHNIGDVLIEARACRSRTMWCDLIGYIIR